MQSHHQTLLWRIKSGNAVIGIVGLGYVGQPLALRYADAGYKVLGFDIDQAKVDQLNAGHSSIEHISDEAIGTAVAAGMECTTDFTRLPEADSIILCVPTPLNAYREPDLSFVTNTCDAITPHLCAGHVISLESTTYPGTTEEEILPRITSSGLKVGEDIFLLYSPEREDPGNANYNTRSIPKVVGGQTEACLEVGVALYEVAIDKVVPVSSPKVAEMTKLLENIHRSVNIGLANEMKVVADAMSIDIFEVIDAAKTKQFGFTAFYPGPGMGGHCIPIDPYYLTWKARAYWLNTRFIELSGEINREMPKYVVSKLVTALNDAGKPLKGSKIMVLGIAYKKNVDDMRESPSVEIMELIEAKGGVVSYSDPHVPVFPQMREHSFDLSSVDITAQSMADVDAVILATDHAKFDYDLVAKHAPLVIDSRGIYRGGEKHIIKA